MKNIIFKKVQATSVEEFFHLYLEENIFIEYISYTDAIKDDLLLEAQIRYEHNQSDEDIILLAYLLYLNSNSAALTLFKSLADKGNKEALFFLGELYREGVFIDKRIETSLYYYQQALPFPPAYTRLGLLYSLGFGITQDVDKGIEFFSEAIKFEEGQACYFLGTIYSQPNLNHYDPDKSLPLLLKAANLNIIEANALIGRAYKYGEGVKVDQSLAFEYFLKASPSNNPYALNNLGEYYEKGIATEKDINKAIYYYEKAASNN